jgi:hypothetical protein
VTEVEPRTIQIGGSGIGKGLRVVLQSTGLYALAGIGVRGDAVTRQDIAANESGLAISMSGGENALVTASETVNVGDLAYSAANGQCSKTSAGAQLWGRWTQAATVGVLGEIECFSVA